MAKKLLVGKVVSKKMQKTVVVEVTRRIRHPVYKKLITKVSRLKADTGDGNYEVGESVRLMPTRPISRHKHFKVVKEELNDTKKNNA
jgi:small subunit ribosomal protein S17